MARRHELLYFVNWLDWISIVRMRVSTQLSWVRPVRPLSAGRSMRGNSSQAERFEGWCDEVDFLDHRRGKRHSRGS
jgi:hypothetical protein